MAKFNIEGQTGNITSSGMISKLFP